MHPCKPVKLSHTVPRAHARVAVPDATSDGSDSSDEIAAAHAKPIDLDTGADDDEDDDEDDENDIDDDETCGNPRFGSQGTF